MKPDKLDRRSCPIHECIFILPLVILGQEKWRETTSKIGQNLSRKITIGFGRIWAKVQLYATVILDSHYNYIQIFDFGRDYEPLFLPDNMYQSQHQAHQMKGKDL